MAKRALEIAAAGGHNVLMRGTPGSGKTMLAQSFMSILPPMHEDEVLEVSKIYSYAGLLKNGESLIAERPFRAPHHSASVASVVGGGTWPRPGEITLAHRGVLFMDEFPEFPRNVLEALRQPLEDRVVSVSRVSGSVQFPAHFMLLAAQNPCPCGYWGDVERQCTCTEYQRQQYQRRVSGPLVDRIDLRVSVMPVDRNVLLADARGERSSQVLARVEAARERQLHRSKDPLLLNGSLDHRMVKKVCVLDGITEKTLVSAAKKLQLSARSFYKTLKIARTIADIATRASIIEDDVLEALQYRGQ
jgi:magnesium chelatase family protein